MVTQTTVKFFIVDLLCREHKEITVISFLDIFSLSKDKLYGGCHDICFGSD